MSMATLSLNPALAGPWPDRVWNLCRGILSQHVMVRKYSTTIGQDSLTLVVSQLKATLQVGSILMLREIERQPLMDGHMQKDIEQRQQDQYLTQRGE